MPNKKNKKMKKKVGRITTIHEFKCFHGENDGSTKFYYIFSIGKKKTSVIIIVINSRKLENIFHLLSFNLCIILINNSPLFLHFFSAYLLSSSSRP